MIRKRLDYLWILIVVSCFFLTYAKTEVPVFLLSGQSNMTGYAAASGLTADQKKSVDNVKIYMDLVWEGDDSKERKWLTVGTGFGSNANNIGPELFLGRTLSEAKPGQKIALIKCSSGSTYLAKASDWLPPSSNNGVGGTLYKRMVNSIDVALKSFNSAFDTTQYTPRWAGFVWLQGEFDAQNLQYSNAYEKNLTNLINDIRAQLKVSDLPVIIPMIDAQGQWTNHAIVRAANVAVKQKMKNVDTLDTKGFATDRTHYTGPGQVKIGTITAQRWLNMNYNYGTVAISNHYSSSPVPSLQTGHSLPSTMFTLSGKKAGSFNDVFTRPLSHSGVFLVKTNKPAELQNRKMVTIKK